MSAPEQRTSAEIPDETPLADLTVGEFKTLMRALLTNVTQPVAASPQTHVAPSAPRQPGPRRSLDDLMNDD